MTITLPPEAERQAPTAFNAGVAAAEAYMRDRVADLDGICNVPEFAYWPKGSSVRRK